MEVWIRARRRCAIAWTMVAIAIATASWLLPTRLFLINQTPSAPAGVYWRVSGHAVPGAYLAFRAEGAGFDALSRIGFELPTIPLLKPIAVGPGEQVCFVRDRWQLGGRRTIPLGDPHWRGIELPLWRDCRVLQADEYFVYSDRIPNSLDSRHFGPVTEAMVIG
ncbi:MAG: S26 family signal peptidase, partial [Nitrospirota bacterium]|nr:S26 family signal peptidase [Nitrospirota bacterium]